MGSEVQQEGTSAECKLSKERWQSYREMKAARRSIGIHQKIFLDLSTGYPNTCFSWFSVYPQLTLAFLPGDENFRIFFLRCLSRKSGSQHQLRIKTLPSSTHPAAASKHACSATPQREATPQGGWDQPPAGTQDEAGEWTQGPIPSNSIPPDDAIRQEKHMLPLSCRSAQVVTKSPAVYRCQAPACLHYRMHRAMLVT